MIKKLIWTNLPIYFPIATKSEIPNTEIIHFKTFIDS